MVDQQLLRLLTPALGQGVGQGRLLRAQAVLRDARRSEGAVTVHRVICTRDCPWGLPEGQRPRNWVAGVHLATVPLVCI